MSVTTQFPSPEGVSFDAIIPQLFQGSRPPVGDYLARRKFQMVVFCAKEYQPPSLLYPGMDVVRVRLDDSGTPMTGEEWRAALGASEIVAQAIRGGCRVYNSCHMGQNRSGLVSALTLVRLTGMSGKEAVRRVKAARPYALGNLWFVGALERLPERPRRAPTPRPFRPVLRGRA